MFLDFFTKPSLNKTQFLLHRNSIWISCQDGATGRHGSPICTTTSKLQLKYRTTTLRTIRNQVEWKSGNYGIKETTSIQTGRRGTDMKQLVPHPCVIGKNSGGVSQEQGILAPHQAS